MKLQLVPLSLREANVFVLEHHRHNKPTAGGKFAIGCSDGDGLIAVAIVGRPLARMLQDGWTAEVLRLCASPDAAKGSCSMLYAAAWRAWRAMGGRRLVTYTLKSENGASLRGAGWRVIAETKGGEWSRPNINRARQWQSIYGQKKLRWEIEEEA